MAVLDDLIAQLAAEGRLLPRTPPAGPGPGVRPITPGVNPPVRTPIEDRKGGQPVLPPRTPPTGPGPGGRPIDPPPGVDPPVRTPPEDRPPDPEQPTIPPPGGPTPSPLPAPDNFSKGQVRPEQMPGGPTSADYGSFNPFAGWGDSAPGGGKAGGPAPAGQASQWDPLGIGQSNYGGGPIGQSPASAANVYGMTGVNAATGYQGPARYGVVGGQGGYGLGMVGPEYTGPVFENPQVALRAMRRQERRLNKPIQATSLATPQAAPPAATGGGTDVNQQKGGQPTQQPATPAQTQGQQAKGGQPAAAAPAGGTVGGTPQTYLDVNGNPISKAAYDAWTSQWRNTLQLPYGHRLYGGPQGNFFESSETAGAPSGVYKQQGTNALHTYQGGQFVPWQQGQAVGTARPGGEIMQQFQQLPRR